MRRIVARMVVFAVVVVLTRGGPPAQAQLSEPPTMTPEAPRPLESDGEVVLTIRSSWSGARVRYMTFDGTCAPPPGAADLHEQFKNPPCEPEARAPADYTAVDREVACTSPSDPCVLTIRIPIVDDDLAEGTEAFTVIAWEEPNGYDTYPYNGPSVIVRITDDDGTDATGGSPASVAATPAATGAGARSSSPASGPLPATPTTTASRRTNPSSSPDLEVALPAGELRPGPGFELTIDESPKPAPKRGGEGESPSWLAFGIGTGALGVGALAFGHRRRRWSSTQA